MITIREIQITVARNFGVDRDEFFSPCRDWDVAHPRQVAMLLAREFTKHSLPRIGKSFGRHHTTILHGIDEAKKRIAEDRELACKVESIRWVLRANHITEQQRMWRLLGLAA